MTPRVSLTMIVKNEAENLRACLDSVAPVVQEIVVVDTGSTDSTRAIAGRCGARVVDFPWCDHFAAARNAGIDHATGEWIFWLDADDRLDAPNRGKLGALFASLTSENAAYMMRCVSLSDGKNESQTSADHARLFRRHPQVRWQHRVHEQILPSVYRSGGSVRATDIVIEHTGYRDKALFRRKLERNLRLLELAQREEPDDPHILSHLGQTYLAFGRVAEALPHLRRGLERAGADGSSTRKLYGQLARAYYQTGQRSEALGVCRRGQSCHPDFAELVFLEGQLLSDLGDLSAAERSFRRLLQPGAPFVSGDAGLCGYKARQSLAAIYRRQGRIADAEMELNAIVAERPDYEPGWLALCELWAAQSRVAEIERAADRLQAAAPGSALSAIFRAWTHRLRGDLPAARRILGEVTGRDPLAFWPRVLLSDILLQEGRDLAEAERLLREVLALNADYAPARQKLSAVVQRRAANLEAGR
jgi:tetratricopeptide (TPR) repeat protein